MEPLLILGLILGSVGVGIAAGFLLFCGIRNDRSQSQLELYKNFFLKRQKEDQGPRIVALGGGTGLSTLLRGLKFFTPHITAVVTVADDGGSSGKLREDLRILPPGDIRNCILALANVEPDMEQLLQYRFKEGTLSGQSMGNLLIAAMTDISGGFEKAIRRISNVLAVTGRVLPVSLEDLYLKAMLEDGTVIKGESQIPIVQMQRNSPIAKVSIEPADSRTLPEVLEAIASADAIVLGPGSLYTSIIPNLLVGEVADAIRKSPAVKIYVSNIMTQPGETTGYSVEDHLDAIDKHGGSGLIDFVLVNSAEIPSVIVKRYLEEGACQVVCRQSPAVGDIRYFYADLADFSGNLVRHNSMALAKTIIEMTTGKP